MIARRSLRRTVAAARWRRDRRRSSPAACPKSEPCWPSSSSATSTCSTTWTGSRWQVQGSVKDQYCSLVPPAGRWQLTVFNKFLLFFFFRSSSRHRELFSDWWWKVWFATNWWENSLVQLFSFLPYFAVVALNFPTVVLLLNSSVQRWSLFWVCFFVFLFLHLWQFSSAAICSWPRSLVTLATATTGSWSWVVESHSGLWWHWPVRTHPETWVCLSHNRVSELTRNNSVHQNIRKSVKKISWKIDQNYFRNS